MITVQYMRYPILRTELGVETTVRRRTGIPELPYRTSPDRVHVILYFGRHSMFDDVSTLKTPSFRTHEPDFHTPCVIPTVETR